MATTKWKTRWFLGHNIPWHRHPSLAPHCSHNHTGYARSGGDLLGEVWLLHTRPICLGPFGQDLADDDNPIQARQGRIPASRLKRNELQINRHSQLLMNKLTTGASVVWLLGC